MDRESILKQLRSDRDRIEEAIEALEGSSAPRSPARKGRRTGGITAAGRKKLSDMMKARWAARRRGARKKK